MLDINNKKFKIKEKNAHINEFINNGLSGYCLNIELKFTGENQNSGYLNLSVGFEKDNDILNFLNRQYYGIPYLKDSLVNSLEIFDTDKFYDTEIESNVYLKIYHLVDNKIKVDIEVNDKLITAKFKGYLNLI